MFKRMIAITVLITVLAVAFVLPTMAAGLEICYEMPNGRVICVPIAVEQVKFKIPDGDPLHRAINFEEVYGSLQTIVEREGRATPSLDSLLGRSGTPQWFLVDSLGETVFLLDAQQEMLVPLHVSVAGH